MYHHLNIKYCISCWVFGTRSNLSASGVICNNFRMTSGHGSMITVIIHEKCLHVTFTVISSVNKSMHDAYV